MVRYDYRWIRSRCISRTIMKITCLRSRNPSSHRRITVRQITFNPMVSLIMLSRITRTTCLSVVCRTTCRRQTRRITRKTSRTSGLAQIRNGVNRKTTADCKKMASMRAGRSSTTENTLCCSMLCSTLDKAQRS